MPKKPKPLTAQQRQLRVVLPETLWQRLEGHATANGFDNMNDAARELVRIALLADQVKP